MRPGSLRWWFENRETGAITVAQPPNLALVVAVGGWLVAAWFGGPLGRLVSILGFGWWGADELLRGVNPWRRVLGAVVMAWQIVRLLG